MPLGSHARIAGSVVPMVALVVQDLVLSDVKVHVQAAQVHANSDVKVHVQAAQVHANSVVQIRVKFSALVIVRTTAVPDANYHVLVIVRATAVPDAVIHVPVIVQTIVLGRVPF